MIINIRGTSGSGKTHTVRSFMEHYGPDSVVKDDKGKTVAHCVYMDMMPVYLIGSYENVCGGCDSIATQDMACSLVRHFSQFGHVIFEGLLMSHLYARYVALYKEMTQEYFVPFVFAFMDTPLELCLERVQQRRLDKGNTKPFNPGNTIGKYNSVLTVIDKFKADGLDVQFIKHKRNPVDQLLKIFNQYDSLAFANSYREESFR